MGVEIRPFGPGDEEAVVGLWTECGLVVAWNDPVRDIRRKLEGQPELFLVVCSGGRIVATVAAGYEGHRGWINYLGVLPEHRRGGIGRRMMDVAEGRLRAAGRPKVNLQVRRGNAGVIAFHRRIGFEKDDVVSLGKRLQPDR